MNKKISIAANTCLLFWFALDMTGLYFGDRYLVTRSYAEDGICRGVYMHIVLSQGRGKF